VGGGGVLAGIGALSADHLEYVSEDSLSAMAKAGTVGVLLPGSTLFLNEPRRPPVELFRKHGVRMALATNCNPGSSPTLSPLLVLALGCSFFRMTPVEALRGMTVHGAAAIGLAGQVGELRVGLPADFVLWEISQPAELCYWLGGSPPRHQAALPSTPRAAPLTPRRVHRPGPVRRRATTRLPSPRAPPSRHRSGHSDQEPPWRTQRAHLPWSAARPRAALQRPPRVPRRLPLQTGRRLFRRRGLLTTPRNKAERYLHGQ
jgi:hypothetical protein